MGLRRKTPWLAVKMTKNMSDEFLPLRSLTAKPCRPTTDKYRQTAAEAGKTREKKSRRRKNDLVKYF